VVNKVQIFSVNPAAIEIFSMRPNLTKPLVVTIEPVFRSRWQKKAVFFRQTTIFYKNEQNSFYE